MGVCFWNYVVARFDDHTVAYMAQEDEHGRRSMEEGVRLRPDGSVEHLGRPEHSLRFAPGTRLLTGATISFGGGEKLECEVLRPLHISRQTGYGFDSDWRHGTYQGPELVVQRHDISTTMPDVVPIPGAIVDNVARFTTSEGSVGHGLFEVMTMGPHAQYFTAWDDFA